MTHAPDMRGRFDGVSTVRRALAFVRLYGGRRREVKQSVDHAEARLNPCNRETGDSVAYVVFLRACEVLRYGGHL